MRIFDYFADNPDYSKKYEEYGGDSSNKTNDEEATELLFSDSPGEDMDGDMGADELELSNMGADGKEPLEGNWSDWWDRTKENAKDSNFEGVGGGGKQEKSKISQIIGASDPTRGASNSFTPVPNPYTEGLPKYLQDSNKYSQLAGRIFGLLTPVRKPYYKSLV